MKIRTSISAIALVLILAVMAACEQQPTSGLPTTHMQIGGKDYTLEIARTSKEQETGLMHRDSLPDDHGMIFPFHTAQIQTFWNHDVHFPLDLLFLDGQGTVVDIEQMEAYSDKNVSSTAPTQYVIELNKGTADKLHVTKGTALQIPQDVQAIAASQP